MKRSVYVSSSRILLILASAFLILGTSAALESRAGEPLPRSFKLTEAMPLDEVRLHEMPRVDVERLLDEDFRKEENRALIGLWIEQGGPVPQRLLTDLDEQARKDLEGFEMRPGIPVPDALLTHLEKTSRVGHRMLVDLTPADSGTWDDLPGGGQIWRLRVRSGDALWMVLGFRTFRLPPGARLHVYDSDRNTVLGPYTHRDMREHRQLWFPPIEADTLVVELYWPEALRSSATKQSLLRDLILGTVSHGYIDISVLPEQPPLTPDSGFCNIDVACPLGANWQDEKRGVVELLLYGSTWCSGSLVNNTAQDCRPYVLTARHCIDTTSEAAGSTFRFNYERPNCGSGTAPTNQTQTGSVLRASRSATDFTLLEMDVPPPAAFGAYFNGWSNSATAGLNSTGIHHPSGDSKKISFNDDPLVNGINYGSDHWRINQWEEGTTEGGSSGSPLFDHNQRIVGQLHGGTASCFSITWDEYGKFDLSWDAGTSASSRLREWLDPVSSGVETLEGLDHDLCLNPLPDLRLDDYFFDDHSGNEDGFPDPGEGVQVEVSVKNLGNVTATNVVGTLTTTTPLVTIPGNVASWPDIVTGTSETSLTPAFDVLVDPSFPCGQKVAFKLALTYDESTEPDQVEFELPIGTPDFLERFNDDVESGVNGWVAQGGWNQSTQESSSPTHSWFARDLQVQIDATLVMPTVVDLPSNATLLFQHWFKTQRNTDGGVLEYSIDGGSNWISAGPLFVANGYNTTIGAAVDSPLAGKPAWSDDSGGWQQVEADLSSLAGEDLTLRWHFATDPTVGDVGWFVDDVFVGNVEYSCALLLPGEASAGATGPFMIDRLAGGDYELTWSAPTTGAPPTGYKLYRTALAQTVAPVCEADLGSGTTATLPTLTDNAGFLVVPVNSVGEGSYGYDSDGTDRPHADPGDVCP